MPIADDHPRPRRDLDHPRGLIEEAYDCCLCFEPGT
jgi:hypothetical protein